MPPCEPTATLLPQYVADGEPSSRPYAALRAHLAGCAPCRAYLDRLRQVERALSRLPQRIPDPAIRARILQAIASQSAASDPWQLLPWTVWVPTLAMVAAAAIALASLVPPGAFPLVAPEWQAVVQRLDAPAPWVALTHIDLGADRLLSLWLGLSTSLAGVGLMLALSRWSSPNSDVLVHLERQVQEAAQRLSQRVRRVG